MSFLMSKEINSCFKNIDFLVNLKKARQIKQRYELSRADKYQIYIKNENKKNFLLFYDIYIILNENSDTIFNLIADNNIEKKIIHSFKCTDCQYVAKNLSYKLDENTFLRIEYIDDCSINNISFWVGMLET